MAWWIILLSVIMSVFSLVHTLILPKLFLKVKYDYDSLPDRGTKVVSEEGGKSIVYEPDVKIRKYIKQYILSERDGKKYIICKIADNVRYIDFDVALFDAEGNSFKVINIKELIKNKGYTNLTELPDKVAYVTLVLNAVNNTEYKSTASKKVVLKGIALYLVLAAVAEIICIISVKACLAKILGGIYFESFLLVPKTWIFTAAECAAVIIINVICTLCIVLIKKRNKKGEELNAWL